MSDNYQNTCICFIQFSVLFCISINVQFLLFLILSFWQQLFIYLFNFLNSTVGLICVNLLIDLDASCKRVECDAPKTSISCHNIY